MNIRRTKRTVTYHVDTNMNALIVCYLLNRKRFSFLNLWELAQILASYKLSPESNKIVTFWNVNKYEKLLTKCEMYDTSNHCRIWTWSGL